MSQRKGREREVEEPVMGRDPLADDDEIVARMFFGAPEGKAAELRPVAPADRAEPQPRAVPKPRGRKRSARRGKAAPSHYRIVSISLYNEDIERIDALVASLKEAGHSKANRSALIRFAIDTVDISKMPRSY